ncbi:MAG: response regulator transcription factor [Paludibacteraceae bacterium]|nr:response regulator transcription factor [Paludibacteraceae bacterium]
MSKRILIVDDEEDILDILRFNLEIEGYEIETHEAPIELGSKLPDLIILDVMMTPKSGFKWAKELKEDVRTANIPIIFCTAKTTEADMLTGFGIGSDDYICKPFRISEVKARVAAILRRTNNTPNDKRDSENIIRYEDITLDLVRKQCTIGGSNIPFTKLEFELFSLLLSSPGEVFSREKILQVVWPNDTIVIDRTVDVNITRIRKKIGRYGKNIRTKFGYGYLFEV